MGPVLVNIIRRFTQKKHYAGNLLKPRKVNEEILISLNDEIFERYT